MVLGKTLKFQEAGVQAVEGQPNTFWSSLRKAKSKIKASSSLAGFPGGPPSRVPTGHARPDSPVHSIRGAHAPGNPCGPGLRHGSCDSARPTRSWRVDRRWNTGCAVRRHVLEGLVEIVDVIGEERA